MPFFALLLAAGAWAAGPRSIERPAAPIVPEAAASAPLEAGPQAELRASPAEAAAPELAPAAPAAPAGAPAASAAQGSAKSASAPARADASADDGRALFDGAAPRQAASAYAETPARARRRARRVQDRRRLLELASGWHHRDQLAKLPAVAPSQAFRLAWIGDAEEGRFWAWRAAFNTPGMFMRVLRAASAEPVHLLVQGGDHVSRGIERFYLGLFEQLHKARSWLDKPLLLMPGNHDGEHPNGRSRFRLHRELSGLGDYALDRGNWRVIFLHTGNQRLTKAQLRWLDEQLDTPRHKLVLTHVPPAYVAERGDWGPLKTFSGFREGSEEFKRILERRGVKDVIFGHVHAYDELDIDGVRYTLSGGGGSALFPGPKIKLYHYLRLDLEPDGTLRKTVRPVQTRDQV